MVDSNSDLKPWRKAVAHEALPHIKRTITEPVALTLVFMLERPKSHLTKSGLAKSAPVQPVYKPDLDKLSRAIGDALSIDCNLLHDDSQIVTLSAQKRYCIGSEEPGVLIGLNVL